MNKELDIKLKFFSFFLMILVVFIHSENLIVKLSTGDLLSQKTSINSFIQNAFSNGFCRISVPLFFIISGFLFFNKIEISIKGFVKKYKSRFYSLFIPYIIWSAYGILLYYLLQLIPLSKDFFTHKINQYSLVEFLNTLFLQPLTHQLWFIKDLMIVVLLSPIIYFLIRKAKVYILFFFFFCWVFDLFLVNQSILFFSIGSYLSICKPKIDTEIFKRSSVFAILVWIFIVLTKTILLIRGKTSNSLDLMILKASILIGIYAIWFLYDVIFENKDLSKGKIWIIFSFSFFIYVFHEPLLTIIQKGLFHFIGFSESKALMIYFLAPIISIVFSVLTGLFLSFKMPHVYKVLTGNR